MKKNIIYLTALIATSGCLSFVSANDVVYESLKEHLQRNLAAVHSTKSANPYGESIKMNEGLPGWMGIPTLKTEGGETSMAGSLANTKTPTFSPRHIVNNRELPIENTLRQTMPQDLPHSSLSLFENGDSSLSLRPAVVDAINLLNRGIWQEARTADEVKLYVEENNIQYKHLFLGLDKHSSQEDFELEYDRLGRPIHPLLSQICRDFNDTLNALVENGTIATEQVSDREAIVELFRNFHNNQEYYNSVKTQLSDDFQTSLDQLKQALGVKFTLKGHGFYFWLGENRAADCLVTIELNNRLYGYFIERADQNKQTFNQEDNSSKILAFPAGMVDIGARGEPTNSQVNQYGGLSTAMREFAEEVGIVLNPIACESKQRTVYKDIVYGESRAGFNAYTTTSLYHIHFDNLEEFRAAASLEDTYDISEVAKRMLIDVGYVFNHYILNQNDNHQMFASHGAMLQKALAQFVSTPEGQILDARLNLLSAEGEKPSFTENTLSFKDLRSMLDSNPKNGELPLFQETSPVAKRYSPTEEGKRQRISE